MSGYLNKATLIGNLGRDPEIRHAADGTKLASLSVATSEFWKDRISGERKDRTEWHRVVIFNEKLAEIAEKYLKKGSKIYIEGQLKTRKWTDQQGIERYTTEITLSKYKGELSMLDSRNAEESVVGDKPSYSPTNQDNNAAVKIESGNSSQELADEIPF